MATVYPLALILALCACLALLAVLVFGALALYLALGDRNPKVAPVISSISDPEAEDFTRHFLATMGHGNQGGDLMPLIAPSFVAKARGGHAELHVNRFSVGAVKILSVAAPYVEVKISHHPPPRPRWAREQTYKLTREQGELFMMPSGIGKHGYINPWWEDAPITRGQKLAFYLLDDPDQPLDKTTPRFQARQLNGKQDFTADLAPAMVVEEKAAFLAGEWERVAGLPDLSEKAQSELADLRAWMAEAPQSHIGYQIER
jgi:hypothetical protein